MVGCCLCMNALTQRLAADALLWLPGLKFGILQAVSCWGATLAAAAAGPCAHSSSLPHGAMSCRNHGGRPGLLAECYRRQAFSSVQRCASHAVSCTWEHASSALMLSLALQATSLAACSGLVRALLPCH